MRINKAVKLHLYSLMIRIRLFEERMTDLAGQGLMPSLPTGDKGFEAIPAGVCAGLNQDDYVITAHPSLGFILAKGGDPTPLAAELLGRKSGYGRGLSGLDRIVVPDIGFLGCFGADAPAVAFGTGLSARLRQAAQVTVCCYDKLELRLDGTIWKPERIIPPCWPVVLVRRIMAQDENPGHGDQGEKSVPEMNGSLRRSSVDGADALAVYRAVHQAVSWARTGLGPVLVECRTDPPARSRKTPTGHDPIRRLGGQLTRSGTATRKVLTEMENKESGVVESATAFALADGYPELRELETGVWAGEVSEP